MWTRTTSSRDNWERLVAAVIKREQFRQLCRQDSITTVNSDLSERNLSSSSNSVRSVSSASSPQHPLTRNSVVHGVVGATVAVLLQNLLAFLMREINFNKDLEKLMQPLLMIKYCLEDAETKQVIDKAIKRWLMKVEAVVFDADYVFNQLLRNKTTKKNKIRSLFSASKSGRIKDIENELKSINEEAMRLGLQIGIATTPETDTRAYLETDSAFTDRVFVGRENDAAKIVEMVKNSPTDNAVSVIPIVGMGGVGKTALARKVFHDDTIISCFENRIWVYVSENFDQVNVFKNIFEALTGKYIDGNKEVVMRKLEEELGGRRYLLVMDDIWNEDIQKWDNFITSLEALSPAKGNVVIVTTRIIHILTIVKTNDILQLEDLSQEDCWSIIKDKAFGGDSIPSEFETVGKNIAQQCLGLPLAAKVVGCLLRGKSEYEWRSIEKNLFSEFGRDLYTVTEIIKRSFNNLPSPLVKKCFAYCSIFPKGLSIEKDGIIHLWMAEGFLGTTEDTDMELVGNMVFNVLLQNSLLQVQKKDSFGNEKVFGMHDMVHDLASFILNDGSHQGLYACRYLTDESSPISKEQAKYLRTLFFSGKTSHITFSNMARLHVLILNDAEMKELPMEIGKLICLRLLDISNTKVELLPDSIGNLNHLQTLKATKEYGGEGCLRKLPRTFTSLTSLRHLYIPNIELPRKFGKLISLQTLPYFQVGDEKGRGIMELGSLENLKGEIEIHNLEKVRDKIEAEHANLFHKPNILKIKLVWNAFRENGQNNDENVLEGLQPHWNLESLEIKGFKGSRFPLWTLRMEVREDIEDRWIRLDNLLELHLSDSERCEEIPMMGHLPRLKSLYLRHLSNVKSIVSSFYGIKDDDGDNETIVGFPALEKLELIRMENLTEWAEVELSSSFRTQPCEVSVFPHLEHLKIENCKLTPSHFPCLKELEIDNMESGLPFANICGSKLTTLLRLKLHKVDGIVSLPHELFNNNRDLSELDISDCPILKQNLNDSEWSKISHIPSIMVDGRSFTVDDL